MAGVCREKSVQTTIGTTVRMKVANFYKTAGGALVSRHDLPTYSFTSTTAITVGDEIADLQLTTPPVGVTSVKLYAGTVLEFPGATATAPKLKITIAADTTIAATATPTPILPAVAAIATPAIARDMGLQFLLGCRNATVVSTIKTEDSTDYLSGLGTEQVVLGVSQKLTVELDLVYDNELHQLIEKMIYDREYVGVHLYTEVRTNDGAKHLGYAMISSSTPAAAVQAKRTLQMEIGYQGECYDYIPPPAPVAP